MLNKGSSSKKRISSKDTPTKSHAASIYVKSSHDLYSEIYRHPLKQILQLRKQQQQGNRVNKSKTPAKLDTINLNTSRLQKQQLDRPSKKISICQESSRNLKTDRSNNELKKERTSEVKRINTCYDQNHYEDEYVRLLREAEEQNKRLKDELKIKKKCFIQIKTSDLMQLVNQFINLKQANHSMMNQINFYRNQCQQQANMVLRVLNL